jgi:pimeloyl-ACP methyl ester carboxylesterase
VWREGGRGPQLLSERPLWDWGLHLPGEFRRRDYRKVLPVVVRDAVSNALANPGAVIRAANLARSADLREELESLAERGLPVSILWGSEDTVVPEATFLAMCEAAGSEGDIIEQAGHSWLLADPAGFGELITNSMVHHATLTERVPSADPARHLDADGGDDDPGPVGVSA